jgi:hypothetical protein
MSGFTFNFTEQQLAQMIPGNPYVPQWYKALCMILPEYGINTPARVAAFVAQCAHESGNFRLLKENLNYKAESLMRVWPSRFPNIEIARQSAMQPEKIAARWRRNNGISRVNRMVATLDRIDSDKGYEPGNIQIACCFANILKSTSSSREWRSFWKKFTGQLSTVNG